MSAEAKATNVKGGGTEVVTLEELAAMPTPVATKTWHPVPHIAVPNTINQLVVDRGWSFVEDDPDRRYDIVVNQTLTKMFGVTKVVIPGIAIDADFQMAIGFRNSHDKSLALRIAVGTNVMVCSNLVISGDIQVRREHTIGIDPLATIGLAFDQIPGAAAKINQWFSDLREIPINGSDGVALLAECVEGGALPIANFMDARASFIAALTGENQQILYGGTVWSVYQAVTEQFKKHSLNRIQDYGVKLNKVIDLHTSTYSVS